MSGDEDGHHLVADLQAVHALASIGVPSAQQHAEQVPPVRSALKASVDDAVDDLVELRECGAVSSARRQRQIQQQRPPRHHQLIEHLEHNLELVRDRRRLVARFGRKQASRYDFERQLAHRLCRFNLLPVPPVGHQRLRTARHHPAVLSDPFALKGRLH